MCGGSVTYSHWSGSRFSVWFRDGSKFFKVWMPVFGSKQIKFVFKFCPLQTVQNIWNLPFWFILNAKHPRRVRIRIRKNNPEPPHLKMPFFGGPLTLFYDQTTTTTTRRRYLCILCRDVSPYGISPPPLQTTYVLSPPTIKQLGIL